MVGRTLLCHKEATPFKFKGNQDVFLYDTSIDIDLLLTNVIYRLNLGQASNYLRDPSKKPNWL